MEDILSAARSVVSDYYNDMPLDAAVSDLMNLIPDATMIHHANFLILINKMSEKFPDAYEDLFEELYQLNGS